ncbi:delta-12 fatty acid desaturase [Lactarius akahatsu]|uniref:Delta-12 fatty acid desaturase n=1 Tax=Lactarius akahatsu TaxID=416441 RepID=A0AAD4LNY1_9AGAM|nr:delta-12 fatty acid desaturase [Lactarius akahatsu]
MKTITKDGVTSVVSQNEVIIPDLTIKDLLSAIPAHCYQRSAVRSGLYVVWDFFLIGVFYKTTTYIEPLLTPAHLSLPAPVLYSFARFTLWSLYGLATGLVATGLWVIAHECGHQAFSESKFINNLVGWILHSGLGVPYHSWRITHAKHHASTGHMTQDQVFVPRTRSQFGLPPLNPDGENHLGTSIKAEVLKELREAIDDSPIGTLFGAGAYLLFGWPMYLIRNAAGQKRYPTGTNHFSPGAVMFAPHQFGQIILSDIGILLWIGTLTAWAYQSGVLQVLRVYLVPYLWVNHWLVLITFLQHTDPLLPHYRSEEFTFSRGALATLDRNLLGDLGSFMGWIGATATHGISETHVAHHVSSKIPHYNAWEASAALKKRLAASGIQLEGRPGGWAEVYRVFRECKFVEDEGNIVFYKNAIGLAASRPIIPGDVASDSGVELEK